MKKATTIAVWVSLSMLLLISWGYFLTDKDQSQEKEIINTPAEAAKLGQAYLEIEYPELLNGDYSYLALFYTDEGYWSVGTLDTETSKSRNLPMVCFDKTGKLISFCLQDD